MIDFILWCAMFGAIVGIGGLLKQAIDLLTRIAGLLYENELRERNRR